MAAEVAKECRHRAVDVLEFGIMGGRLHGWIKNPLAVRQVFGKVRITESERLDGRLQRFHQPLVVLWNVELVANQYSRKHSSPIFHVLCVPHQPHIENCGVRRLAVPFGFVPPFP